MHREVLNRSFVFPTGAVLIRNWRALSFDTISPGPMVTVGELFGELSTIATLRIQILRPKSSLIQDMKDKLLRLLLVQSHSLLLRSGCPLDTVSHFLLLTARFTRGEGLKISLNELNLRKDYINSRVLILLEHSLPAEPRRWPFTDDSERETVSMRFRHCLGKRMQTISYRFSISRRTKMRISVPRPRDVFHGRRQI